MINISRGYDNTVFKIMVVLFISLLLCCNKDQQPKPAKNLKELAIMEKSKPMKEVSKNAKLKESSKNAQLSTKYFVESFPEEVREKAYLEFKKRTDFLEEDFKKRNCCLIDWEFVSLYNNLTSISRHDDLARNIISSLRNLMYDSLCEEYLIYLNTKEALQTDGRIILKFTIKTNGSIVNDTILSSTMNNKKFDEKIKNRVKLWKWKISENTFTLTVPFVFRPVR